MSDLKKIIEGLDFAVVDDSGNAIYAISEDQLKALLVEFEKEVLKADSDYKMDLLNFNNGSKKPSYQSPLEEIDL